MLSPAELFGKALMLEPGDRIVLPCRNRYEMERLRVSLYRQLNKLRKVNRDEADNLSISREHSPKDNKHIIYIYHAPRVGDAFIERKDGQIEELALESASPTTELERICRLMKEDGISDEEIEQYREEYTATMPDNN